MDDIKQDKLQNKILVVEDSVVAMKAVSSILIKMNYHVDVATEGQMAIKLAKENHYDLIFMDIELPDINGYEITKSIRANEGNNKPVPIVALTAHIDESSKIQCINMGMNDVVTKPLSTKQAEEILATLIHHRDITPKIDDYVASAKREKYASLPLFDFACVLDQFHDEKIARDMIILFAKTLPEVRSTLKNAYDRQDWGMIQKITHRLKGGTSCCGLKRLYQICFDLNDAIKANNKIAYNGLYGWIFQIINATLEMLKSNGLIKK